MRATILYILELSKHHLFPPVNSMRGFTSRSEMKVQREKNDSNDGEREKGSDCQKRLAWPLLRSILENMNHHTLKFKRRIVYNLTCLWMQITSPSGSVNRRQHLNLTRMWMDLFQLYTDLIARNHFVPSFLLLHLFNKLESSTIRRSYRNESILSKNQTFLV